MDTIENDTAHGPATLEFAGLSSIADEESAELGKAQADQSAQAHAEADARAEDATEGWLQAVDVAGEIIGATWPSARPVWNPPAKERLAAALARCDEAYGWGGVGAIMSHPLLGLAFAGFPLVLGTAKAVAEERRKAAVDVEARDAIKPTVADPMGAAAGVPQGDQGAGAA
jgi:hypothetical protein